MSGITLVSSNQKQNFRRAVLSLLPGQMLFGLTLNLRNRHFFIFDILALLLMPALALTLRLDGLGWWPAQVYALGLYLLAGLLVKLPLFYELGLYQRYWRYASVNDFARVLMAVFISTVFITSLFMAGQVYLQPYGLAMPRSVPLIDGMLTLIAVSGLRMTHRSLYHWHRRQTGLSGGRRVLVVGAGEGGQMVVRELRANPQLKMQPVAFIDDDPDKINSHIQGLPVLGCIQDMAWLVNQHHIEHIVVALPSTPLKRQLEITTLGRDTGVVTQRLAGVYDLLAGHKTINPLPNYDINQLLQREPILMDQAEVAAHLANKTVLVTGAGGSIGSELCRQIARGQPRAIIMLGHGENSIFETGLDLRLSFPALTIKPVIVDVRNRRSIDQVVKETRPDIIFHAAAHKHVPFMESHAAEAIANNVEGTQNVLHAAEKYGVAHFVLISTDKAVNPTSIMGATKRIAELLVMISAKRSGRAYMAVRFGNVLGSRGSVLRIFQQQLAAGGPLTITHPDMRRYFMTIPEAVQLVLQANALGRGGEIFVLDMGQQIRIQDMAIQLIKLCGLVPGRDIDIEFSGIRPGEKLYEELFLSSETYGRTNHNKIFVSPHQVDTPQAEALEQVVKALIETARGRKGEIGPAQLHTLLTDTCHYIDQYQYSGHKLKIKQPPNIYPPRSPLVREEV